MWPYACSKGGHLQRKGFPCIYGFFFPFHITKEGVGQRSSNVRAKLQSASERVCKREGLTSPGLGCTASTVELWEACGREKATAEDSLLSCLEVCMGHTGPWMRSLCGHSLSGLAFSLHPIPFHLSFHLHPVAAMSFLQSMSPSELTVHFFLLFASQCVNLDGGE